MTAAISRILPGLFCSAHGQCPRGGVALGAGAGRAGIDCSGDLLSGCCKHNHSTWGNFPSSQGCALGTGADSGFGWQRFRGTVGMWVLVLACSEGLRLGRAPAFGTSLFISNQMSTSSVSHLASDSGHVLGASVPKQELHLPGFGLFKSSQLPLGRAWGAVQPPGTVGGRILTLWQICILLQPPHHRPGQLEPIWVEQNYF